MSDTPYVINLIRLRTDGTSLKRLATIGQTVLILTFLATPLVLYAIEQPAAPDIDFWVFLRENLITGLAVLVNAYALLKGTVTWVALDRTRRLGHSLSGNNPLGSDTLNHLKWLGCIMCALTLVMSISIETVPTLIEPKFKVAFSFTSLYFGVMVITGLSVVRRIASEAVTLKAETQEFI